MQKYFLNLEYIVKKIMYIRRVNRSLKCCGGGVPGAGVPNYRVPEFRTG